MTENRRKKRRRIPVDSPIPKRRRKGRRGLFAVPIFLIALIAGTVLCCTVFFKVETVTVRGNTRYTPTQIITASGIEIGDNLLRLKKSKAITGIEDNLCYAETVTVQKRLPNEIIINVGEPVRTAIISSGADDFVLISGKGRVLEYGYGGVGIRYEGLDVTVENGYAVGSDGALERLNDIAGAFEEGGLAQITAIGTNSPTVHYAVWARRVKIQLGPADDLAQKVKFAKYFIETELGENEVGIADVSAGKRLYFDPGVWAAESETIPEPSEPEEASAQS